jgi:hypothetical protein
MVNHGFPRLHTFVFQMFLNLICYKQLRIDLNSNGFFNLFLFLLFFFFSLPQSKFVKNSTKLTCIEITGHQIKYMTIFFANATTCPLWTSRSPLPVVAEL